VNGDARYRFGRLQRRHERSAAGQPPHPQGRVAAAADDDRVPSGSLPTATALTPWCGRIAAPRPGRPRPAATPAPRRRGRGLSAAARPDRRGQPVLERLLPDARHCVSLGRRPGSLPTAGRRSPAAPSRRAPARLAASRAELRWEYPPAGGAQGSCTSAHDRGSLARRGSGSVYAPGGCSYAHNSRRCTEPAEVPIITRVPDGVTLGLIMITGWRATRGRMR
jgi:hypothetical protein